MWSWLKEWGHHFWCLGLTTKTWCHITWPQLLSRKSNCFLCAVCGTCIYKYSEMAITQASIIQILWLIRGIFKVPSFLFRQSTMCNLRPAIVWAFFLIPIRPRIIAVLLYICSQQTSIDWYYNWQVIIAQAILSSKQSMIVL